MKRWFAAPSAILLAFLAYSLATAPLSFVFLGQYVYGWPDARIVVLEVFSILAILPAAVMSRRPSTTKVVAIFCAGFAAFNLLMFVLFNYDTNAPDGIASGVFSTQSAMTLLKVMYAMRLSPIYGLAGQSIAWFTAMVASVFVLRLSKGPVVAFLESAEFATCVLAAYALGVYVLIPQWSERAITGLQSETIVSWYTNDDLLIVALAASVFLAVARLRVRPSVSRPG
jgi:hypothetical protein